MKLHNIDLIKIKRKDGKYLRGPCFKTMRVRVFVWMLYVINFSDEGSPAREPQFSTEKNAAIVIENEVIYNYLILLLFKLFPVEVVVNYKNKV